MTKARDISSLIGSSGQIDNAKITLDVNEIPSLTTDKIPNLDAGKITTGTFADARISQSSVSQHATSFDDNKIVNDISTLALRQASDQNKSAYNTNSQSVDVFQDDTGIDTTTDVSRNASEYVSSVSSIIATADSGGTFVQSGSLGTTDAYDWLTPLQVYGNTNYYSLSSTSVELGQGNSYNFSMLYRSDLTNDIVFGSLAHNATSNTINRFQLGLTTNTGGTNIFSSPSGTVNVPASNWNTSSFSDNYIFTWQGNGTADWQILKNGSVLANGTHNFTHSQNTSTDTRVLAIRKGNTLSFAYQEGSSGTRTKFYTLTSSEFNSSANMWGVYSIGGNSTGNVQYYPTIRHNATEIQGESYSTVGATGNFTGTTITAPSSVSEMGAIITYQDQAGTNALNTDIVLQLSADGGSNYSTATLTALPDFSTGIKMAKVNDLAVTAGTQLKYKINFANQALGSKEARIRGVALQY